MIIVVFLGDKKKKEGKERMKIPTIKDKHRYRVLPNGRMDRYDVLDLKTNEIIRTNFSTQAEAQVKIKELTDQAVSEEDLESFTRECNAIADEWDEDLNMLVITKEYLNDPAVKKVVEENKQK